MHYLLLHNLIPEKCSKSPPKLHIALNKNNGVLSRKCIGVHKECVIMRSCIGWNMGNVANKSHRSSIRVHRVIMLFKYFCKEVT